MPTNTDKSRETALKSIRDRIKKLNALWEKPRNMVQEIGVDIVAHAKDYGDCSEALPLVKAVPLQMQRSLIQWFMAVSPIGVLIRQNADDKVRFIKEKKNDGEANPAYNDFDLDKARVLSWWEMDKEQTTREIQQIYAGGVFENVIKLLDRAIEGKDTKTVHYTDSAKEAAARLKDEVLKYRSAFEKAPAGKPANDPDKKEELKEKAAA